jgi:hypothetical protein
MGHKFRTNQEFIKHITQFAPTGALGEVFVVEAIRQYSLTIAGTDPTKIDTPLLSGEAWVRTGKWIKEQYEANY